MPRRAAPAAFAPVGLDPARDIPLVRQLYDEVRAAILDGRLPPGTRLPSTRALARDLGLSRNTVLGAFEQLVAEGYVEGRVGAGTTVALARPEDVLEVGAARASATARDGAPAPGDEAAVRGRPARLSTRGRVLARVPYTAARGSGAAVPFRPGLPAIDLFPFETWRRLAARFWAAPPPALLGYGDPAGWRPLREEIARHLAAARAVRCAPEQVIVVAGSQQALDLVARVLLDPGDRVWFEDPGYVGARGALQAAGAELVPVDVDGEGLDVAQAERRAPAARLAYVSPSHQYPTGAVLSRARRLALLAWARRAGAWVVEDDYDSEYRYEGWPLESLQGLDGGRRVIYVGTFSKVLLPAFRLGYLVVPPALVDAFTNARALADRHPPGPEQGVLAEFLAEGHFARHVRRMRTVYAARQAALVGAVRRECGGALEVDPAPAGMHLLARLAPGVDDRAVSDAAERLGVVAPALSQYALRRPRRGGLLLGYAACEPRALVAATRTLARALAGVTGRRKEGG